MEPGVGGILMKKAASTILLLIFIASSAFAIGYGTIKIIIPPNKYEVYVNHVKVPEGSYEKKIKAGKHRVIIKLKDGTSVYDQYVTVKQGGIKFVYLPADSEAPSTQEAVVKPAAPPTKEAEKPSNDLTEQKLEHETMMISYTQDPKINFSGTMYGLNYSLTRRMGSLMLGFQLRYSDGYVNYPSQVMGLFNIKADNVSDHSGELRLLAGYGFEMFGARITPFTGAGYRTFMDNINQAVNSGVHTLSTYIYLPVGLEIMSKLDRSSSISLIIESDSLSSGNTLYALNGTDPEYDDINFTQTVGSGFRASLAYLTNLFGYDLEFKLFSRTWDIGKSADADMVKNDEVVAQTNLQKNKTTESGLSIGLKF
jgi:hypothetical protein